MKARVGIGSVKPGQMRELTKQLTESLYPAYQDCAGYAGGLLLKDTESGKVMSITLWNSEQELLAAEATTETQRAAMSDLFAAQRLRETYDVTEARVNARV